MFRYDLRYQQIAEFIRCYKINSIKIHIDEIVVALWNNVQTRTGRGLDTIGEGGIVIDRQVILILLNFNSLLPYHDDITKFLW